MRKESRMWGKPRRGGVPDIEGSAYPELRAMRSLGVINVVRLRRRGRCTVRGTRYTVHGARYTVHGASPQSKNLAIHSLAWSHRHVEPQARHLPAIDLSLCKGNGTEQTDVSRSLS